MQPLRDKAIVITGAGRGIGAACAREAARLGAKVGFLLSDQANRINGQIVRINGRQLALLAHPMIAAPVLERESWNFEEVAAAFAEQLEQRQFPIGIASAQVIPMSGGSVMWGSKRAAD